MLWATIIVVVGEEIQKIEACAYKVASKLRGHFLHYA